MRQHHSLSLLLLIPLCIANHFGERIPTEARGTGHLSDFPQTGTMLIPRQIFQCDYVCPNTSCPQTTTHWVTPTSTWTAPYPASAEPTGPYHAGDCDVSYKANLNITVWQDYKCGGSSTLMENLAYSASQWLQVGFRSFKVSRAVHKDESLFFAQFADIPLYTVAPPPGATQQSIAWLCGQRVGGILTPQAWPWTPDDCWSIPGDGFAQCIKIQRTGVCGKERNLPPSSNWTVGSPTAAPVAGRAATLAPAASLSAPPQDKGEITTDSSAAGTVPLERGDGAVAGISTAPAPAASSAFPAQRRGIITRDSLNTETVLLEERDDGAAATTAAAASTTLPHCELPADDSRCKNGQSPTATWCNNVTPVTSTTDPVTVTVIPSGAP